MLSTHPCSVTCSFESLAFELDCLLSIELASNLLIELNEENHWTVICSASTELVALQRLSSAGKVCECRRNECSIVPGQQILRKPHKISIWFFYILAMYEYFLGM